MSAYTEIWLLSLLRCSAVAAGATGIALAVCALLRRLHDDHVGRWSWRAAWGMMLAPLLTPALLTGYYYRGYTLQLARHPNWNEVIYIAVLIAHLAPLAALVIYFAPPPPISAAAAHTARMGRGGLSTATLLAGRWRNVLVAAAVVFLLAFGDFEIAILFDRKTWTLEMLYALNGARSGHTPLLSLLARNWPSLLTEIIVLGGALWLLRRGREPAPESADPPRRLPPALHRATWVYLVVAAAGLTVLPVVAVGRQSVGGMASLWQQGHIIENLQAGLIFALAATLICYLAALLLVRRAHWGVVLACCLPGLLGALVLGLIIISLLQLPALNWIYLDDRPEPLVIGLVLLFMPAAVLLTVLRQMAIPPQAEHLTRLLAASTDPGPRAWTRRLRWHLVGQAHVWTLALLFVFIFFEITLTHLLHPSDMMPSTVSAYNNMHAGQNAVLSARVVMNFTLVVVVLLTGLGAGWMVNRILPLRRL